MIESLWPIGGLVLLKKSLGLIFAVVYAIERNKDLLKVLDQITLENKFCLNFKIRSVFI